jgi:predicted amidophosphoribosyltransferase
MPLTLCPNCRLPVHAAAATCPECGALRSAPHVERRVPIAAVIAFFATLALVARRMA